MWLKKGYVKILVFNCHINCRTQSVLYATVLLQTTLCRDPVPRETRQQLHISRYYFNIQWRGSRGVHSVLLAHMREYQPSGPHGLTVRMDYDNIGNKKHGDIPLFVAG